MRSPFLAIGLIALLQTGCSVKRPVATDLGITVVVDGARCHSVTTMFGCTDVSVSPPIGCKRSLTLYDKNCEVIVTKGDKSK